MVMMERWSTPARPRYAFFENVAAVGAATNGFDIVGPTTLRRCRAANNSMSGEQYGDS